MPISLSEARGVFTRALVARWNELSELAPKNFLGSFFGKATTTSKEVSIEVMRGTEKVASDVLRGTQGNRNTFSKSSEKLFIPPFYNEWFDVTELNHYDLLFGDAASAPSGAVITGMIEQALDKLNILKYKIERAYELQRAQVLTSGIVELKSGDNIDFKRKAASMVAKSAGAYWTVNTVDPREDLQAGAEFLRNTGKAGTGEFNVVMGAKALAAFLKNPFIVNSLVKDVKLIDLQLPQTNAMGGSFHGRVSCGPYIVNVWSYPETYENAEGVSVPYIDVNHIVMLPVSGTRFTMSFAGIPAIIRDARNAEFPEYIRQMEADYFINNYIDPFGKKHVFEILSAGLAVPVSVDRIYSSKVTGSEVVGG